MAQSLGTVFEQALDEFKASLSPEDTNDFTGTTLTKLRVTISAIQSKQKSTRKAQNLSRITGFLEAIETYTKVLDVFVNVHEFVAFIWGPMKLLLTVASTFAEAFNALLDAYQRIAENLPILEQYQSLFGGDRMQRALATTFTDIFEFHRRAIKYFRGGVWKQLFHATWKQFDTKFKALLDDMRHHKRLVERQATIEEYENARRDRSLAAEKFRILEEQEMLRRKTYLWSWLSAANVQSDQEKGVTARQEHPQSGRWLLARDKFRTWYDPRSAAAPLLWITGIPGAGKSVIASLIVEEALKLPSTAVLYFYCRHGDPQRNTFLGMARSFLNEILRHNDPVTTFLFDAATTSGEIALNTRKVAEQLLDTCLKTLGKTYIILDGLDECSGIEQRHIAIWLRKYVDVSAAGSEPSRCVFLSQDDGSTRPLLSKVPTLSISKIDNYSDIELYCQSGGRRIQTKFGLSDQATVEIALKTAQRAEGMFLFAKLVISNLYDQTTRRNLYSEMQPNVFPSGLEAAYSRILDRILVQAPVPSQREAQRLLAWIVCASRPLKWREIQAAVSINSEEQTINIELDQLVLGAKELCGSIIEEALDGEVSLVHSTAEFFLVKEDYVKVADENLKLAQLCVEYFSLPVFGRQMSPVCLDDNLLKGCYAFLDYSAVNWITHLEQSLKAKPTRALIDIFERSLRVFFTLHWRHEAKKAKIPREVISIFGGIEGLDLRGEILDTVASLRASRLANLEEVKGLATTDIFDTLYEVRARAETLYNDPSCRGMLTEYYGSRLFKCYRLSCKWFHEGFSTEQDRDFHKLKHERPYYCEVPGCHLATLGCSTLRKLESHISTYHEHRPSEDDFPLVAEDLEKESRVSTDKSVDNPAHASNVDWKDGSEETTSAALPEALSEAHTEAHTEAHSEAPSEAPFEAHFECRLEVHPEKHSGALPRAQRPPETLECLVCSKKFTRKGNLRTHMGIHQSLRLFRCYLCGKEFSRRSDCRRHEGIHLRDNQVVCNGVLSTGSKWGCSKRFKNSSGLSRHLKSEAGQLCRKPPLVEEAAPSSELEQQPGASFADNNESVPSLDGCNRSPTASILQRNQNAGSADATVAGDSELIGQKSSYSTTTSDTNRET